MGKHEVDRRRGISGHFRREALLMAGAILAVIVVGLAAGLLAPLPLRVVQ